MSNEYKRPAVVLTEEMKRAARNAPLPMVLLDSISARKDLEFESKFYAAIAAAPQPPALGDEVEIGIGSDEVIEELKMMADMADNNEDPDDHMMYMRWLAAIRSANAQAAPLQAELERLAYELNCAKGLANLTKGNLVEAKEERDQLKARCDELEALLPKYQRGSTGLSGEVERLTLIAREAAISSAHRYSYMPALPEDAQNWKPHEWVLEAMRRVELDALSKPTGSEKAQTQDIPSRTINLSGCELTESDLLESAVRAVRGSRRNTLPRWALVRDAFCVGSGVGTALCRRFGFDPEEILKS